MFTWTLLFLTWMQAVHTPEKDAPIAITGVNIFDGTGKAPIYNGVVVMCNGRFTAVGKRGRVTVPANARIVAARGKWLIPGLIDMHVHLDEVLTSTTFVLYGVTSVRDVGSNLKTIQGLRQRGEMEALPRIYWMGRNIDEGKPSWWGAVAVKNAQEVPQLLDTMQAEGVDGVKLYVLAKPDVTRAVIAQAHQRGLPVTGHLAATLPSIAANAGIDNLEHVTTLFQELRVLPPHTPEGYGKTFAGVPEVKLNGAKTRQLIGAITRHHVAVTPTLAVALLPWQGQAGAAKTYGAWAKVPDGWKRFWHNPYWEFIGTKGWAQQDFTRAKRSRTQFLSLVERLKQNHTRLIAGTDTPAPWVLPGAGLLAELQLLTQAGLTPKDALLSATVCAAQVLRKEKDVGTIQPGRYADCVLLDANPLQDIRNARRIHTVFLNGRKIDRRKLQRDFQNANPKAIKLGP